MGIKKLSYGNGRSYMDNVYQNGLDEIGNQLDSDNKKDFIRLLRDTKRDGIEDLIKWLDTKTDFFIAPASTKYHLSCKGGLLQHSLNVLDQLVIQASMEVSDEDLSQEMINTIAIVALLHDVCKANFYIEKEKNVKNEKGDWIKEPFYTINDSFPVGHGEKSVILIQKFIDLTDDEILAIRWHMGAFEPKESYNSLSNAFNKSWLALDLHIADLKATYIDEKV